MPGSARLSDERPTRLLLPCHLPKKDTASGRAAFQRELTDRPSQLRLSLTYDHGKK